MIVWESLKKIDDSTRNRHHHLDPHDQCFYCLEYTSGVGYDGSEVNSFILNFKKPATERDELIRRYKLPAIDTAAENLAKLLRKALDRTIMVPIPPSKTRRHPEYDDRMLRLLKKIQEHARKNWNIDTEVFEAVEQTEDMEAAHTSSSHRSIDKLIQAYKTIDSSEVSLAGKKIAIFDDVLTTGAHFKAMQHVISQNYRVPAQEIFGVFLARVVS